MAKRVKVKLSRTGMGEFLSGGEVRSLVGVQAAMVAGRAGQGFDHDTWISPVAGMSARGNVNPPRVVGGVTATTTEARIRNARDQVLLRALYGGALPPEAEMVTYTRKDGTTRKATRAQAENWMKQRRGG